MSKGKLVFFYGKMGAGKSTLTKQIVEEKDGILISEDDLLSKLYADKINSFKDYKIYSDALKPVVLNISQQILSKGLVVVLDFPANTPSQRVWLRSLSDSINAEHICYFMDRTDEVCIKQLLQRGNPNTDTVEMFHAISRYFKEPNDEESINVAKV